MDASKDAQNRNNAIDNGLSASPLSPATASSNNTDEKNIGGEQKENGNGNGNVRKSLSNVNFNASGNGRLGNDHNRCEKCGKKLGLTGAFSCRCGFNFCAVHRYSFQHDCNVDYRALGAEQIRRDNPVVNAQKIRKF